MTPGEISSWEIPNTDDDSTVNRTMEALARRYHPLLPTGELRTYYFCGVAGEAGEVLDNYKKTIGGVMPLNRESLVEELGDLQYAIAMLMIGEHIGQFEINHSLAAKLDDLFPAGVWSAEAYQDYRRRKHGGELK